ncbi:MAG: S-layer homology domain-containing protein [Armatimonas sp.]
MSRVYFPKNLLLASLAVGSTLITSAAFAQDGTFKDVPNNHWAYEAIERLVKLKPPIFIGDAKGALNGKGNLTRQEMAVVLSRLLENIEANTAKKSELTSIRGGIASDTVKRSELDTLVKKSDLVGFATKADVDALSRLVAESHSELATRSVSLDALKKRLAGLEDRVGKKTTKTLPQRPEQRGQ